MAILNPYSSSIFQVLLSAGADHRRSSVASTIWWAIACHLALFFSSPSILHLIICLFLASLCHTLQDRFMTRYSYCQQLARGSVRRHCYFRFDYCKNCIFCLLEYPETLYVTSSIPRLHSTLHLLSRSAHFSVLKACWSSVPPAIMQALPYHHNEDLRINEITIASCGICGFDIREHAHGQRICVRRMCFRMIASCHIFWAKTFLCIIGTLLTSWRPRKDRRGCWDGAGQCWCEGWSACHWKPAQWVWQVSRGAGSDSESFVSGPKAPRWEMALAYGDDDVFTPKGVGVSLSLLY